MGLLSNNVCSIMMRGKIPRFFYDEIVTVNGGLTAD
jgi:hypothetical protein